MRNKFEDSAELFKFKPKGGKLVHVIAANLGINLKTGSTVLPIPFEVTWEMPNGKSKKTTANVSATHCPFCGASMEVKK